jgi:hypothetical protein
MGARGIEARFCLSDIAAARGTQVCFLPLFYLNYLLIHLSHDAETPNTPLFAAPRSASPKPNNLYLMFQPYQ